MTEILATEATLSTLSVEIKALTVSGKQMTLAVFRQLPQMETTTPAAELWPTARYWGIVRYAIKDEGDLWAVIEVDGKLHRGLIRDRDELYYRRDSGIVPTEVAEAGRHWAAAWDAMDKTQRDYKAQKDKPVQPGMPDAMSYGHGKYPNYGTPEGKAYDKAYSVWMAEEQALDKHWNEEQKEKIARLTQAEREASNSYRALRWKYANRHNSAIAILRSLPQLFIAV